MGLFFEYRNCFHIIRRRKYFITKSFKNMGGDVAERYLIFSNENFFAACLCFREMTVQVISTQNCSFYIFRQNYSKRFFSFLTTSLKISEALDDEDCPSGCFAGDIFDKLRSISMSFLSHFMIFSAALLQSTQDSSSKNRIGPIDPSKKAHISDYLRPAFYNFTLMSLKDNHTIR